MSNSSLMVRTAVRLRQGSRPEGTRVAVLDLTAVGQNLAPEKWCRVCRTTWEPTWTWKTSWRSSGERAPTCGRSGDG